ncbi:MAG: peptidoglycan DD-metalloendopeptidase family protein [Bradyrhizobium sp.]|uniref:peptidoglycan DD-metalloendopeptidase family protein n=1 Tax=Bradyrhizobium sp. TaxID=376 RepID=UPI00272EFCF7|nr:peptidoglycan DD-metalloendopeptidase family protein [Bradyrhizobium sp.]MDP1866588.1 peptidoglycan DD-metalloendopeptidase family protein [Bradyrhizobium sp.]
MSRVVELLYSRRVPHVAALALMSFGFAGCSADMQTRLSQNNLSNPFASQPETTNSVRAPAVERRELPQYSRPQAQYQAQPQYQSQPLPPPISAPQSYPAAHSGVSGGGRGLSSYAPPTQQPLETTATVAPRSVAAVRGPAQAQAGTTIIVGTSDTLEGLSRRYNVSSAAILQANGYKGPRALSPGQQLIIPRQTAAAAAPAPALAAPASKPVAAAAPTVHVVNRGDTLLSIARRNNVTAADLSRANGLDSSSKLKLGQKLTMPGVRTAAAQPVAVAAVQPAAPATRTAAAAGTPPQSARLASATAKVEDAPAAEAPVKASEATGALPTFRWPVRGKVITTYGAKTNGKANDGINLAVPEGTPVKAAEDGVVAYSGNELKGYGNLVLVRHSNGYVTAYAHASELLVKRGDTIKRGQIIAKSGQSGEVGSPQLHFEIRKGSSPVDPLQFLNGA